MAFEHTQDADVCEAPGCPPSERETDATLPKHAKSVYFRGYNDARNTFGDPVKEVFSLVLIAFLSGAASLVACAAGGGGNGEDRTIAARLRMVERQIKARGIKDKSVLDAMGRVPRHLFVPPALIEQAYDDGPLPIGRGQTISQPYIVALMTELIRPRPEDRVLDVGTGSGYQAAVLAEVVREVYSIEIVEELAESARRRLAEMGYDSVHVRAGDGYRGWPEVAPFDAILVAAAPDHIPQPLLDQLKVGGRLVIPVGAADQDLVLVTRTPTGYVRENIAGVRFVPMTGEARKTPVQ